jgi:hypothetical protein
VSSVAVNPDAPETAGESQTSLSGCERGRVVPRPLKFLQVMTGYLLLRWVVLLIVRYLFGYRVRSRISLDGDKVAYHSAVFLLGRRIREVDEIYLRRDLLKVGVEKRFPHLLLLLGALGLLIGSVYGITAVIDGIQAAYVTISLIGLGILTAGVLFDIGLGALAGHIGDRTALLVTLKNGEQWWSAQRFRIVGVEEASARAFVEAVASAEESE